MDINAIERDRRIAALYESGKKIIELAAEFGLSSSRIQQILASRGLSRRSRMIGKRSDRDEEKRTAVFEKLKSGMSAVDVAKCFGISDTRISHYVDELKANGAAYSEFVDAVDRAKFTKKSGIQSTEFKSLPEANKAFEAFCVQRGRAKDRGVAWEMSFAEWWKVWSDSGKWWKRGRARVGVYVMARLGDTGPYKVENVEIITHSQNVSDSWKNVDRSLIRNDLGQFQRKNDAGP